MPGTPPALGLHDADTPPSAGEIQTMALHVEDAVLSKRVRKTVVRAATVTSTRDELVEADLAHDQIVVERVAIGRIVEAVPPARQEGDVTILPVVEEEVVVIRRLVLKEEVHLRRVRTVTRHSETVELREQHVEVTRTPVDLD